MEDIRHHRGNWRVFPQRALTFIKIIPAEQLVPATSPAQERCPPICAAFLHQLQIPFGEDTDQGDKCGNVIMWEMWK